MIAHLDNRCLHTLITGIGNHPTPPPPHMSGSGDNTSDDGVCSLARANAADLRRTDHVQWGRPDSEEVIKQAEPTPWGALQP